MLLSSQTAVYDKWAAEVGFDLVKSAEKIISETK
jgi:hypothetical protein